MATTSTSNSPSKFSHELTAKHKIEPTRIKNYPEDTCSIHMQKLVRASEQAEPRRRCRRHGRDETGQCNQKCLADDFGAGGNADASTNRLNLYKSRSRNRTGREGEEMQEGIARGASSSTFNPQALRRAAPFRRAPPTVPSTVDSSAFTVAFSPLLLLR